MQDQARVVIIGSGIAGSSIAYHLTEVGMARYRCAGTRASHLAARHRTPLVWWGNCAHR